MEPSGEQNPCLPFLPHPSQQSDRSVKERFWRRPFSKVYFFFIFISLCPFISALTAYCGAMASRRSYGDSQILVFSTSDHVFVKYQCISTLVIVNALAIKLLLVCYLVFHSLLFGIPYVHLFWRNLLWLIKLACKE